MAAALSHTCHCLAHRTHQCEEPGAARGVSLIVKKVPATCLPPAALLVASDLPARQVPERPQRIVVETVQEADAKGMIAVVVLAILACGAVLQCPWFAPLRRIVTRMSIKIPYEGRIRAVV